MHSEGHTAHQLPAAVPTAPAQGHIMATTRFLPVQSGWRDSRDTGQQRGAPAAGQQSCSWKGREQPSSAWVQVSSPCGGQSQCTKGISAHRELFSFLCLHPEWVHTRKESLPSHAEFRACGHGEETVFRSPMMGYETFHPEVTGPFPALAWVTADHKPVLLDGHQVPCMR